ncbi:hypothetical protein SBA4_480012 [Candidatus Sulfopaludibacter sp. SbA4]|nr:hypothetical protein SBA4_480012 [Candidatus Sulfopaludibacter sp. SbA4]
MTVIALTPRRRLASPRVIHSKPMSIAYANSHKDKSRTGFLGFL